MIKFPLVTQYMTSQLIIFRAETPIGEAIDTILRQKISGAPVLDKDGALVGMLSEVDCLRLIVDSAYNEEPVQMLKVSDFMSTAVATIPSHHSVFDAANTFLSTRLKRLPVIEKGKVIGQISRVDVLRAVREMRVPERHVPSTWKGREPSMPDYKKTRHTESS
jgi:predicted transcriptional regulator